MNLSLTTTGTFDESDIQSIRVFFEPHGGNGVYDNGAGVDDVNVLGAGTYTFSGGIATIAIDPTLNTVDDIANGNDHFYIVFELQSGALASACSIGCEVTGITFGDPPGGTGGDGSPMTVTAHGTQKPVDAYSVNATGAGIVLNSEEFQGATNVQVLKITLTPDDTDASTRIALGSLKVHTVGDRDADLMAGGVLLYEDTNDSGAFDGGDTLLGSTTLGSPAAGYATITSATPATVPDTGRFSSSR